MAVQKSRVSPSRRGMRRAHDALSAKEVATDPTRARDGTRRTAGNLHITGRPP